MKGKALALAVALALAFGSLPAAHAGEEPQPPGLKDAVYSATAGGSDGSWLSASVLWDDMPSRLGLPTHNADRTFYPGDALRSRVAGNHSAGYEDLVSISGGAVAAKSIGVGGTFDQKEDVQIRTDAKPGLQDVNFTLFPKNGIIDVTVVDEDGRLSSARNVYANGMFLGSGTGMYTLGQGEYTISFEPAPENVAAPPSVKVVLTPARRLNIVAYYRYLGAENNRPRTDISVLDSGADSFLPMLTATLRVYVVPYNPRFVVVPYLCQNLSRYGSAVQSSYEMPFAVLVRYDGNQYDPENENSLSLDQRVLLDGISFQGDISWPLRSDGEQQRRLDNGGLAFLDNGDPVMYEDGEELYHDNGMPKLEIANVAVISDSRVPGGYFNLAPAYKLPENLREEVYTHEEIFGHGLFSWLNFHDVRVTGSSEGPGGEMISGILAADGGPIVFDGTNRYRKFVFTLQDEALSWVAGGGGTLALDLSLWSTANSGRAFEAEVEWEPLYLRQPVEVTAWRLEPWARDAAVENAQVLYRDEAWMADSRVSFDVSFVPVFDAENFLYIARDYARAAAPFTKGFLGKSLENLKTALGNALSYAPQELRGLVTGSDLEILPSASAALYSLANLDNYMIGTIIEDTGIENSGSQRISGVGKADAVVDSRGFPLFAVEELARLTGENTETKQEIVDLPFDNKTVYAFDINLSGEGMVAEVTADTASKLELRIHAPPRSGGLQSVRILDNEGKLLYWQDFLPSSLLAQLSAFAPLLGASSGASAESAKTLTFDKTPNTPTQIYVELTNSWGASSTQKLSVLPWVPVSGIETNIWGWLVFAGIFIVAWAAFVNWLRARRKLA